MRWDLLGSGVALTLLLGHAVAMRWKLRWHQSLAGLTLACLVVALPMLWIYQRLTIGWLEVLGVVGQVIAGLAAALVLALFYFQRDPEREASADKRAILAAADGEVLYVTRLAAGTMPLVTKHGRPYRLDELMGSQLWQGGSLVIGIEMNLLDVHVNRCPIPGKVIQTQHIKGRFISLRREEAPFVNERLTTVIRGPLLTVAVVQVASRLVRRIESYLALQQEVAAGQRLGKIRFGSLVAVVLPLREQLQVEVRPGDRVQAGRSVLARVMGDLEERSS